MTTFDERLRALSWGRELLEELVAAQEPSPARELAASLLPNYPTVTEIDVRLEKRTGYALLLTVRSIERASGLLDRLRVEAGSPLRDRALFIARHFPEREELALAVRSPYAARTWAAMYLDSSPGRTALLRDDRPAASTSSVSKRQRRQALRQLEPLLWRLQRDPALTLFALGQVQLTLQALPSRQLLATRFQGEGLLALNQHLRGLQQACQVVEAVVGGIFASSRWGRNEARRLLPRLPAGDWFALNVIGEVGRQAWLDELFMRRPRRGGSGA